MNFDVPTMNCLGSWREKWYWLQSPPLSCHMSGVLKIFLQRPNIALLLHRISHVAHCVYILTKVLLLFTLLLKMAYMWLMVGEMEACTCVTYIAKSNNGSMKMTNHTSWSRLCMCVEQEWWMIKIKDSLHESPSPLFEWHEDMAIFFSLSFFLGRVHFFGSCFFGTPSWQETYTR